jgi:hypothetical protein
VSSVHPSDWVIPSWHEDFGDPKVEVEMLRSLCVALLRACPSLDMRLVTPEEGYVTLSLFLADRQLGELHVVDGDPRKRYVLFTIVAGIETDEIYFQTVEEGVETIGKLLQATSAEDFRNADKH